jgi:hypothetical protein
MELRPVQGQSITDYLVRLMPGVEVRFRPSKDMIDPLAAKTLFSLWKNESSKTASNTYRRPPTMGANQIESMTKAGLARQIGNKIEITEKGARVIRIMLLGDDHSSLDDDGSMIDYAKALSNTKIAKRKGKTKCASIWDTLEFKIAEGSTWTSGEIDSHENDVCIEKYDEITNVVLVKGSKGKQFYNLDEFLSEFDLVIK